MHIYVHTILCFISRAGGFGAAAAGLTVPLGVSRQLPPFPHHGSPRPAHPLWTVMVGGGCCERPLPRHEGLVKKRRVRKGLSTAAPPGGSRGGGAAATCCSQVEVVL